MYIHYHEKELIKLTKLQKAVLKSLALKGAGNIQTIQLREEMNYPSTHRSIKELEKRGLIWLSNIGDRGPKSAQEYSITPLGIVASILFCELSNDTGIISRNWLNLTPKFVRHWKEYEKHDLSESLLNVLKKIYVDVSLLRIDNQLENEYVGQFYIERPNLMDILRNSLDMHFLTISYINLLDKMEVITDIISKTREYREVWEKWYSLRLLHFSHLKSLDEKMNRVSN